MGLPVGSAFQVVGANAAATGLTNLTVAGTANQVVVTPTGTTITLSTPQSIGTGSSPTFAGLTLSSPLTAANGGTGATANTGSGNNVLATSPTLVTPVLGAATATSINFGQTTLSTYQEGTFTPVLTFGGASVGITYSAQTGRYTRIGRMVMYEVRLTLSSKGSSTGSATITGLPFAAGSRAYAAAYIASMAVGVSNPMVEIDTTTLFLVNVASGTVAAITNSDFTNTTTFQLTGTYSI